jgi:hypothetical protein
MALEVGFGISATIIAAVVASSSFLQRSPSSGNRRVDLGLDLPEEFEAPRLVEPRPLDEPRERFGDWPRALRELLPRSSIVLVANHEEEVGRRAEEIFKGIGGWW